MDELLSFAGNALSTDPERSNLVIARDICTWSHSGAKDLRVSKCERLEVAAFLELVRKVRELGNMFPS
jgi:hypothetical protein